MRRGYVAFESDIRAGASEVYVHGMPGGQYTNLREQARSLGIDDYRWPEVAQAYAQVNEMFGDIVKVTPTSKVVGDMAITMVTSGLTREAVLDPAVEIAFPDSVVRLFHGELGQPVGGFPPALQKKVLGGKAPLDVRPGELLPPADLDAERKRAEAKVGRAISDDELASYLMYPKVFADYAANRSAFGDVGTLPTSVFFYGMEAGTGDQHRSGAGQDAHRALCHHQRAARGRHAHGVLRAQRPAAAHSGRGSQPGGEAPAAAQGRAGQRSPCGRAHARHDRHGAGARGATLTKGEVVLTLEAMKMETTLRAERDGTIKEILARPGQQVDTKDLLIVYD